MAIEDLVDDYWREMLTSDVTPQLAQQKWMDFIYGLKDRVANFPKDAQDEVFMRCAVHNQKRIDVARLNLDDLRVELGLPVKNNRLAEIAAETVVRATVWHSVGAFFRLFR